MSAKDRTEHAGQRQEGGADTGPELETANLTVRAFHRHQRRRDEVDDEDPAIDLAGLRVGQERRRSGGDRQHDHHGDDENHPGRAVHRVALARDHRHEARDHGHRRARDVQEQQDVGQDVQEGRSLGPEAEDVVGFTGFHDGFPCWIGRRARLSRATAGRRTGFSGRT
ncbi:MAG: hypothetical protein M3Q74_13855 [Pseudomonadota bacterium]|nr:hypothetical protein [Pseudomonadota bacterium]